MKQRINRTYVNVCFRKMKRHLVAKICNILGGPVPLKFIQRNAAARLCEAGLDLHKFAAAFPLVFR